MKELSQKAAATIPVIVDSMKKKGRFTMSRCSYFSIQCDHPSTDWTLGVRKKKIPFLMIGVSGIITQPSETSDRFDRPEKIRDFFNTVEEDPDLYVDQNDIWLPNFLLSGLVPKKPRIMSVPKYENLTFKGARGLVFRLSKELFQSAYSFRNGDIGKTTFESTCKSLRRPVVLSESETTAFTTWQFGLIKEVYDFHHQHKAKNLKWKK